MKNIIRSLTIKTIIIPAMVCFSFTAFAQKKTLHILEDTISATEDNKPVMGWNSYNCFGATVREDEVKANADFIAANLIQLGWQYVVVDYCWSYPHTPKSIQSNPPQFRLPEDGSYVPWLAMDNYGRLLPAQQKFPSAANNAGFKPLADYIHGKGLQFGIHLMRGIPRQAVWDKSPVKNMVGIDASMIADTNAICPWLNNMYGLDMSKKGAQEYLNSLFELYAAWGVDFVKIDDLSSPYYEKEIEGYRKAMDNCGRKIIFSTSPGATPLAKGNHINKMAQQWRVSDDFWDNWHQLYNMFEFANNWTPFRTTGHFTDLDMLQLGRLSRRGPAGIERESRFTPDEKRTHFTLWCIAKSPLIFGGDLTVIDSFTLSLINNKEVNAVNQLGTDARQLYRTNDLVVWVSKMKDSKIWNVAFFNLTDKNNKVSIKLSDLGIAGKAAVRDLWMKKELGKFKKEFSMAINSHGARLYQISY